MPLGWPHILQASPDTQHSDFAAYQRALFPSQAHILLITSNPLLSKLYNDAFADEYFICTIASDQAAAQLLLTDESGKQPTYDLLVGEVCSNTFESSIPFETLHGQVSPPAVIVIGPPSVDSVLGALRLGIADYLTSPVEPEQLRESALRILAQRQQIVQETLAQQHHAFGTARPHSIAQDSHADTSAMADDSSLNET